MKTKMDFRSRWVLVTGASSGLGKEMACQLARTHKANLILVARRVERLQELKESLENAYGIQCRIIQADLTNQDDVDRVYHESVSFGEVYGVILNAGITYFGKHLSLDWKAFQNMLATNVTSVVRLVHLFVPYLLEKNQGGGIMLISSIAGFLPVPYQSAYAGTKAFITNFGQSLYQELRDENISITVFSPGGIATDMTRDSGLATQFENSVFVQQVEPCAEDALRAMINRRYLSVPGKFNQAQLLLSRLVPRKVLGFIAATAYKKALA